MITKEEVDSYIAQVPAAPAVLRETIAHVRSGDLTKAAKTAEEDKALVLYLKTLVNRPIYGFRTEVHEVPQIFGILGISSAQQILYHYLLSLISPKKWSLFDLTNTQFFDLQASLGKNWEKIIRHLELHTQEIESAITLLPASIIVCDALFGSRKSDVELLRNVKALDYSTILYRLSGKSLYDVCNDIADKWEMSDVVKKIVHASSAQDSDLDPKTELLAKWMHLLLFYELSKGVYVSAGLNEFLDFQIEFVEDIYESFMTVVGAE